ncbi:S9 family peptidase [Paracrocinitomix mangrovi]|uniref:S9 family peptidase n=1 Tax=Paracrocinitomix mangrovi TaxID=2862509 RepID=UPI001C8D33F6|nr:S9 family peptidase [Paracrocinitomix mangrovi]UKN02969.1 S9 family peptidase [Paracrocinitomix mangrovi]
MIKPPIAKKISKLLKIHQSERIDNYYWMNDREHPDVISYLNAENDYTKAILKPTEEAQELLFKEMRARVKEDDMSAPYLKNGYWYYSRYETGQEHPIHCRKNGSLEAEEEILMDENEEAKNHPYYEVVSFTISKDNTLMAFAEDITGRRLYQIRFKNLKTGEILDHKIENCSSDLAWHNNNTDLYFCLRDVKTLRPYQVHKYNISDKSDNIIYTEKDDTYICSVEINKDFKHLLISSHSTLTTEYQIKSADDDSNFELFLAREEDHEYYPEMDGNIAFIKTNKNAENFRLVKCNLSDRSYDKWEEIQAHNDDIYIEDFEVFKSHIVVVEKENGLSQLKIYDRKSNKNFVLPPKEETYMLYLGTNPEIDQDNFRIGYTSMTTPHSVYDVDFKNFQWTLVKQQVVQGDFDSTNYQSERVWANGRDGVKVPCSLVYHKDKFKKDGSNPILIYAYGSYGSTIDPYFSSVRLSLLDRGFVFAIAHIRGGEYLGRHWYDTGKLLFKKNTFYDFIDVAKHLVDNKFADSENVFAMGGSAGGLLMGAIANIEPKLWKGIVMQVPFVDVVTTMLDDSIPLTTGEYDEWGNPNKKVYYDYMLSYSPYDNIEAKDYPSMLITSGLHDSQVQYWEPTKYIAKLREYKTDNNIVLLHTNMDAGHGGASGRFESMKEIALEYAFIFWRSGISVK